MRLVALAALCLLLAGCAQQSAVQSEPPRTEDRMRPPAEEPMRISSPAFQHNGHIPAKYTCQGADISPPLEIAGVLPGAQSLVLIMDDPDAPRGTWDHWVVWNISPATTSIPEGGVPPGGVVGQNSWPRNAYGGPCPPSGTHRYFFKLYALDNTLDLPPSARKADVERAMQGHILGQAEIIGLYVKR